MIYLYAGLGMAMLLPILVGLQTAVSVAELEQGELAMQDQGQNVIREFSERQKVKTDLREDGISRFKDALAPGDESTQSCPAQVTGFKGPSPDCIFFSMPSKEGLGSDYVLRVFRGAGEWSSCLVVVSDESSRCPKEV